MMGNAEKETNEMWNYLRTNKRNVEGWLQRVDAEIFGAILSYQNKEKNYGSCVEIGVHHGKSFIPLCQSLISDEKAYCIDIFDEQNKNKDQSGRGNLETFQSNLSRFHIDASKVVIRKGSSEDVSSKEIIDAVGRARFFSIDGGHWKSVVINDLKLAEDTILPGGVIALDDFFRAEWPEVTAGYYAWENSTRSDIVPFAIGSNKLYLCRKPCVERYQKILKTTFLTQFFSKTYQSESGPIDNYRIEPVEQDEDNARFALGIALRVFRPDIYMRFPNTLASRMRKR